MSIDVLVAGIGNVFLGDDGFGVEVARRLAADPPIEGVSVVDFGVRTLHLSYELLNPPRFLIVVDACARGEAPGTLYVLEPEQLPAPSNDVADAHSMSIDTVFRSLAALGGAPPPLRVIGCEPGSLDEGIGLSSAVEEAIPRAVELVRREITRRMDASTAKEKEKTS